MFCFFQDQFAFRPTGSTTVSQIFLIHRISSILKYSQHMHIILLDFSKAFDSVRHHTLFQKCQNTLFMIFCTTGLFHFYWQITLHQAGWIISSVLGIKHSIIQWSDLALSCLCIMHLNVVNKICKFPDLPDLAILPLSHTIPAELENMANWAKNNNLKLIQTESHEMIVRKLLLIDSSINPPTTNGIEWDGCPWCKTDWLINTISFYLQVLTTLWTAPPRTTT